MIHVRKSWRRIENGGMVKRLNRQVIFNSVLPHFHFHFHQSLSEQVGHEFTINLQKGKKRAAAAQERKMKLYVVA